MCLDLMNLYILYLYIFFFLFSDFDLINVFLIPFWIFLLYNNFFVFIFFAAKLWTQKKMKNRLTKIMYKKKSERIILESLKPSLPTRIFICLCAFIISKGFVSTLLHLHMVQKCYRNSRLYPGLVINRINHKENLPIWNLEMKPWFLCSAPSTMSIISIFFIHFLHILFQLLRFFYFFSYQRKYLYTFDSNPKRTQEKQLHKQKTKIKKTLCKIIYWM